MSVTLPRGKQELLASNSGSIGVRPDVRWFRWSIRHVERCFALIGVMCVVYMAGFHYSCVVSSSMRPTLQGSNASDGDRVITEKFSYYFREPRRWEVLTIRRESDGLEVMKRVVGLPGEELQILLDGQLVINGREVDPPKALGFLKYLPVANVHGDKVFNCEDGYYVLGDEAMDSDDSRFNGTVSRDEIIGRSWLIIGPPNRRGFVNSG
ncbi:MAG: signal peptidase I [Pirellulales bacterium]